MESIDPKALVLFAKVVEFGGISPAGRMLGLPKATISRAITKLETSFGTRLLERSSRKMRLTESGVTILQHGQHIAEEVEEAKAAIGSIQTVSSGQLRIASPFTFGRSLLSPVLPKFLAQNPALRVQVELTNRIVDPVEENFDFVIRLGPLADTSLIAKQLGVVDFAPCASPDYLKTHGKLKHPHDLALHAIIDFFDGADRLHWTFTRADEKVNVELAPRFDANDPIMRRDAAVAGIGVTLLPYWMAQQQVDLGNLQLVLPRWKSTRTSGIFALYPNRRSLSLKSRAFLAFLAKEIPDKLGTVKTSELVV